MQRQPAVAGQFYSGNAEQLRSDLAAMIPFCADKKQVFGIIAPHAGYMYSGAIAGKVYASITIPETVLVLGPNHHGTGEGAALFPAGEWQTPLGPVAINSRLNSLISQHAALVSFDTLAHRFEHSLEVQIPFLQSLRPDVTFSALCLAHGPFAALCQIGQGIAAAIRDYGKDVLIIASSDMNHFESAETSRRKDMLALERILAFDAEGLLRICRSEKITMCGAIPAAVMLLAAGELGASRAELVAYGNSGDVTGDSRQVVGYAAVTVS